MTWPRVIGLGSSHGDDQAGWLVVDRLREQGYPAERLARAQHAADVLDLCDHESMAVICDACVGAVAGSVTSFDWPTDRLVYQRPVGSHDFSLGEALELASHLEQGPRAVQIWAIAGETWTAGELPSAAVQAAARDVAKAILRGASRHA